MKVIISESQSIRIRRRMEEINKAFDEVISDANMFELGDYDDFYSYVVHEVAEKISTDLDSYNEFYEYLDDALGKKIKKAWKNSL
jgi:hypothetical protein